MQQARTHIIEPEGLSYASPCVFVTTACACDVNLLITCNKNKIFYGCHLSACVYSCSFIFPACLESKNICVYCSELLYDSIKFITTFDVPFKEPNRFAWVPVSGRTRSEVEMKNLSGFG